MKITCENNKLKASMIIFWVLSVAILPVLVALGLLLLKLMHYNFTATAGGYWFFATMLLLFAFIAFFIVFVTFLILAIVKTMHYRHLKREL